MPTITELDELAKQYFNAGDFVEAKRVCDEAIELALAAPAPEYHLLARLFNNTGFICRLLNDPAEAERYFEEAVEAYRLAEITDDPELAITLQHLGRMAYLRTDYATAQRIWTDELDQWKRIIKDEETAANIPYMATNLHALGVLMADTGKYAGALQNMQQALELLDTMLPPDHPETVETLGDLGQLCAFMGDLPAAQTYLRRAIPLHEAALGADHPRVKQLVSTLTRVEQQLQ